MTARWIGGILGAGLAGFGLALVITGFGYVVVVGYLLLLAGAATIAVVHTDEGGRP